MGNISVTLPIDKANKHWALFFFLAELSGFMYSMLMKMVLNSSSFHKIPPKNEALCTWQIQYVLCEIEIR